MGCGDTDLMGSGVERSSGKKQRGRAGALSVEQTVMSVYDLVARHSDMRISHRHALEKPKSTRLPPGHAQTPFPPTSSLTSIDGINVSNTARYLQLR
jgi:hypothetical protein